MDIIALIVGPIVKTLQNARSTKELWAGSYLFSYLMREIILHLGDKKFYLPNPEATKVPLNKYYGAGTFPDVLIFESEKPDEELKELEEIINQVLKQFAQDMIRHFMMLPGKKQLSINGVEEFVRAYFNFHGIKISLPNSGIGEAISIAKHHLSVQELQEAWMQTEKVNRRDNSKKVFQNYLDTYFSTIHRSALFKKIFDDENLGKYDFLKEIYTEKDKILEKRGQGRDDIKVGFPSTRDIASFEIFEKVQKEGGQTRDSYIELMADALILDEEGKQKGREERYFESMGILRDKDDIKLLEPYHKYICIVYGDGDGLSNIIGKLDNYDAYKGFNKKLGQFRQSAAETINEYGGKPVYIGGDDFLFFTPVKSQKGTVFDLIEQLQRDFNNLQLENSPTLSFGISISYHKFPLFESVEIARSLLNDKAKEFKAGNKTKNAVAIRLTKHSGTYFEVVLNKAQETFKQLRKLSKSFVNADAYLSSLLFKVKDNETLLQDLFVTAKEKENYDRFGQYFDNFFNENIHQGEKGEAFKTALKDLLIAVFKEFGYTPGEIPDELTDTQKKELLEKPIRIFYSIVRLAHFMTPKNVKIDEPVNA